ncbi:MAG: MMPL family transporter [Candidatus Nanopelagicales bacterium]
MAELLYRLGKWAAHNPWRVIAAWIAALVLAGVGYTVGHKELANSFDIPGMPSSEVVARLQESLPQYSGAAGTVVFGSEDGSALTIEQQTAISALAASAADLPDVAAVVDPFAAEAQRAAQAAQLETGKAQIAAGRAQLKAEQKKLAAGQAKLAAGRKQVTGAIEAAQAAGAPAEQLAALRTQLKGLDAQQKELAAGAKKLAAGEAEIAAQEQQLQAGAALLAHAAPIRVVSADGSTAVVNVSFTRPRLDLDTASKEAVVAHFTAESIPGVEVGVSTEIAQGVPKIIGVGEAAGVLIALLVLLIMLRSAIGALIPIMTALTGVAIGVLASLSFSGIVQMAVVTPVLGVMLGLAVGIDYSLFILNRHRKQLRAGAELGESVGLADGTAGNAVVFAGSTVIVALLALNVTGIPFLGVMGSVGAVAVATAVLIAVSLTPALLGLAGQRVLDLSHREEAAPPTLESAQPMPNRRAILTTLGAVAVLGVLAIPAMSMRVGLPDGGSEPVGSQAQRAFVMTEAKFGPGANGPLLVTASLPDGLSQEQIAGAQLQVVNAVAGLEGVTAVAPVAVAQDGGLAAFQVIPDGGPNSEVTENVVRELRTLTPLEGAGELGVAGQAAINIDISERLSDILPIYLLVVVGLSLLIMVVVFRSLVVPLIATGGFILSLLATYGAIVAVFQWGWLSGLFGIETPGPILNFLPVILVGILFGLAMDYQLFLSTGMREAYAHGMPARQAVMAGYRIGHNVVIAAGLIMVAVFGGFVFSESTIIRSLGFGLAVGILLDAFVVRLLLMPALMHLVGERAWWLPNWLDRILPNVDVEGAALERRHHVF